MARVRFQPPNPHVHVSHDALKRPMCLLVMGRKGERRLCYQGAIWGCWGPRLCRLTFRGFVSGIFLWFLWFRFCHYHPAAFNGLPSGHLNLLGIVPVSELRAAVGGMTSGRAKYVLNLAGRPAGVVVTNSCNWACWYGGLTSQ